MRYQRLIAQVSSEFDPLWDVRYAYSGMTSNSLRFFPVTPDGAVTMNNYQQNPLVGDEDYSVMGLGFSPTLQVIKGDQYIDPLKIYNAITNAKVKLVINDRDRVLLHPLSMYIDFGNAKLTPALNPDGEGGYVATYDLELCASRVHRLQVPFPLSPDEIFKLTLEFGTWGADLPSATDWANSAQSQGEDFGFLCCLQVGVER